MWPPASGAGDRERDVVALTILRYSQEEIAKLVGKRSVRAVEGTLYRWRTREKGYLEASEQ